MNLSYHLVNIQYPGSSEREIADERVNQQLQLQPAAAASDDHHQTVSLVSGSRSTDAISSGNHNANANRNELSNPSSSSSEQQLQQQQSQQMLMGGLLLLSGLGIGLGFLSTLAVCYFRYQKSCATVGAKDCGQQPAKLGGCKHDDQRTNRLAKQQQQLEAPNCKM